MAVSRYISDPIPAPASEQVDRFKRADLIFYGVDHSGPSFEARIFTNKTDANQDTPKEDPSYLGSFHVFGHGGCFGDIGHCDIPRGPGDSFDRRLPHPLLPHTITLEITDFLREKLRQHADDAFTVTIVPVAYGWARNQEGGTDNLLQFERLALVTYT